MGQGSGYGQGTQGLTQGSQGQGQGQSLTQQAASYIPGLLQGTLALSWSTKCSCQTVLQIGLCSNPSI